MKTERALEKARALDPALLAHVCERMANGATALEVIRETEGLDRGTLWRWAQGPDATPTAASMYASARESQADAHADEIMDIAKRAVRGEVDPNAARVFIDAAKWTASKLRPKVYGEKLDLAIEHRAELLVLDYGRSDPAARAIDVTPLTSGEAQRIVAAVKRKPKRERVESMSPKRRAKYEANRTKLEAQRKAFKAESSTPRTKKGARRVGRKRGRG